MKERYSENDAEKEQSTVQLLFMVALGDWTQDLRASGMKSFV